MGETNGVTQAKRGEGLVVRIEDEQGANLLCYFLASVLTRSIREKTGQKVPGLFDKGVRVLAGGMTAYIYREPQGLLVSRAGRGKPGLSVEGDLGVLLGVLLGKGVVMPFLRGDLRVGGNILGALRLLGFLKGTGSRPSAGESRHG